MRLLAEPRTRGLDLDDPETTVRRRDLALSKKSLNLSYRKWYAQFQEIDRMAPPGIRLELGSGGGFLAEVIPGLVTTDVLPLPFVDMVCQAEDLPQADGTVGAIFMINVLHHVCDVDRFFKEAQRVLVDGGVVAMIEPYVSPFSRVVYTHLHHEPFETSAPSWKLEASGPLSGGNDALPWNIFVRDRAIYDRRYPGLVVEEVRPHTFLSHLLSGGVTLRSLVPAAAIPLLQALESRLGPSIRHVAVFATIVLRKSRRTSENSPGGEPA